MAQNDLDLPTLLPPPPECATLPDVFGAGVCTQMPHACLLGKLALLVIAPALLISLM